MSILNRALILTALPLECTAVLRYLTDLNEEHHRRGTIYQRGRFFGWDILVAQTGAGNNVAAQEAERAMEYFHPQIALFVGVGGGIKDVTLGDVVAATKIYGYESGTDSTTFYPRPDIGLSSYPLVQRARSMVLTNIWRSRIYHQPSTPPRAFVAPIVAGEKVVKSSAGVVASLLHQTYGDAVAVEMEGAGFIRAAYASSMDSIVIRGISDLLDNKSTADSTGWQERAADHAAAFAFELLANMANQSPSQVADATEEATTVNIWDELRELAPRLYPIGPRESEVWTDAGGDTSRLELAGDGRTQWARAIRKLQNGGGGQITVSALIQRMLQEYPDNLVLNFLNGETKNENL